MSYPSSCVLPMIEPLEHRRLLSSSISGRCFNDADGNGVFGLDEQGQSGFHVFLDTNYNGKYDANEPIKKVSSTGTFTFSNLSIGKYWVRQFVRTGWRITTPTAGYYQVRLRVGHNARGLNFGNTQLPLMSGVVFADTNGNGKRDAGETALTGFYVYLDYDNDGKLDGVDPFSTEESDGSFKFDFGFSPGTYHVRIAPQAEFKLTTPASGVYDITVAAGHAFTNLNFGEQKI